MENLSLKAKLFRGLSDPSRMAILELLRDGPKTVSEVVAATNLSQPNASAHLACLRDCGLVASRQEGRHVYYALSDARMEILMDAAEGILSGISERISDCSNYDCRIAQKCVSDKKCVSSVRVAPMQPSGTAIFPMAKN